MQLTWNELANKWEGGADDTPDALVFNTYAELPDPTTQMTGQRALVVADPADSLNGPHFALGGPVGGMATYWRSA